MKYRSLWKRLLLLAVPVLVGFILLAALGPSSPSGRYTADKRIAIEGDVHWELADGKVWLVHEKGRIFFGRYFKAHDAWVWDDAQAPNVPPCHIIPSWWGFRVIDPASKQTGTLGYRRFW